MKGISNVSVGVIVAAIIALLFFTGTLNGVFAILNGPKHCSESPFDFNCFCGETESRIGVPYIGNLPPTVPVLTYYHCVAEGEQIPEQTVAQQYLTTQFPSCDTINCNEPGMSIRYGEGGGIVIAECATMTGSSTKVWWAVYMNEDGTVWDDLPGYPYCISLDGTYYS